MSSTPSLNIVFAGTPDFSATVLELILAAGHRVSAVYCQPDRRVGRGKKLAFGPVKVLAVEKGIAVEQPIRFNQDVDEQGVTAAEKLASYQPDLMIVVAYGLILPQAVLDIPKYGCVNIHASLLPRWRGAAPIQRAIEQGDTDTGITIMQMDKGLDTGNMLLTQSCAIEATDTGAILHDRLALMGSLAINQFLASFSTNSGAGSGLSIGSVLSSGSGSGSGSLLGSKYSPGEIQDDSLMTYAHKLSKAEAEIDWSESANQIEQKIRAFNSWPVCFTYVGKHRLRIWQAKIAAEPSDSEPTEAQSCKIQSCKVKLGTIIGFDKQGVRVRCGDGQNLLLTQLQADGSRAMSAAEMLNSKSQWFSEYSVMGNSNEPSGTV
jgi:methionyl-tRNA formyltransferase